MSLSVMPKRGDGWPLAAALIAVAAVFGCVVGVGVGRLFIWVAER